MVRYAMRLLLGCFCVFFTTAQAQFAGGNGQGFGNITYVSPLSCSFFFGGNNDGYVAELLQSTANCGMFTGGNGDGYDTASWQGVCIMYWGDSTDGYKSAELLSGQNCLFFKGNGGQGYDTAYLASPQNCILFMGSAGQGYTAPLYDNPYNCPQFMASPSGGDGSVAALGVCLTLPIEGSPLFARMESTHRGLLSWQTYTELNNAGFEIQKSLDGIAWDVIGWVDGHGTSLATISYNFVDERAAADIQYYRYRQIDIDGKFVYSNVVSLTNDNKPSDISFSVYPNPATDVFAVQYWGEQPIEVSIMLYDMLGREVMRQNLPALGTSDRVQIPCYDLSAGAYILAIQPTDAAYKRITTRVIIAK